MGTPASIWSPHASHQAHRHAQRRPAQCHRLSVARCSGKLRMNYCAVHWMVRVSLSEGFPVEAEPEQNQLNLHTGTVHYYARLARTRTHTPAYSPHHPSGSIVVIAAARLRLQLSGPHPGHPRPHTATWGAPIQIEHAPTQLRHHRCSQARSLLCL